MALACVAQVQAAPLSVAEIHGRDGAPWSTVPASSPIAAALQIAAESPAFQGTQALVVTHRGRVALAHFASDSDRAALWDGGEMTSGVVTLLYGILEAERRVPAPKDAVAEAVPEWRRDRLRGLMTWEDVLANQSGLSTRTPRVAPDRVVGRDVARGTLAVPASSTPGVRYQPNPANAQLLALAIEQGTGQPLSEVLSDRLWRPIGASDASWGVDRPQGHPLASCCLSATATDWARIGTLLAFHGRYADTAVVPRAWCLQMAVPTPGMPDLGWNLWRNEVGPSSVKAAERGEPFAAPDVVWLEGSRGQRVFAVPSMQLAVVRMGPEDGWDDSVALNAVIRAVRSASAAPAP